MGIGKEIVDIIISTIDWFEHIIRDASMEKNDNQRVRIYIRVHQ